MNDALAIKPGSMEISASGRGVALLPRTLEEGMKLAALLAESSIVPAQFRGKPGDVFVAMQLGMEVGLSPIQAIQSIAVINGRPTIWGDTVLGLVMASGLLESIDETLEYPEGATPAQIIACCRVVRGGRITERRFSWEDAVRAKLSEKDLYKAYPQRMLAMRARSWALRDAFPDVLRGLQVREEVDDYAPPSPPTDADLMPRRKSLTTGEAAAPAVEQASDVVAGSAGSSPAPAAPAPDETRSLADELVGAAAKRQEADVPAAGHVVTAVQQAGEHGFVPAVATSVPDAAALTRQRDGLLTTFDLACGARGIGAKQIAAWWEKCAPGKGPDTCTAEEATALVTEVEALPIRTAVTINGKRYLTMGCTAEQLLQAFTLSAAVDAKAGKETAAGVLLNEFGLKTRVDLDKETAERYLIRLKEIAG